MMDKNIYRGKRMPRTSPITPLLKAYETLERLEPYAVMDKEDVAFLERELSMRWFRGYIKKYGSDRTAMLLTELIERSVTK